MSDRLDEQVRLLMERVVEESPPPPPLPAPAGGSPARLRPVWVTVFSALVVLVVIGGVALGAILLGGGNAPVLTDDQPTTTTTVQDPSSATFGAEFADGWLKVPVASFESPSGEWPWVSAITTGGPGLVATGSFDSVGLPPAVWTSADGLAWSLVPDLDVLEGGTISDVVSGPEGLVAVGTWCSDPGVGCMAAIWTSPDGTAWSRGLPDPEVLPECPDTGCEVNVGQVIETDFGLVASGLIAEPGLRSQPLSVLLFSEDGLGWRRVSDDAAVFGPGAWSVYGLRTSGPDVGVDGLLCSQAGVADQPLACEQVVWHSVDGETWTRFLIDGYPSCGVTDVIEFNGGAVAVGTDCITDAGGFEGPAAWYSDDGRTWSTAVVLGTYPSEVRMHRVLETDFGLLAFAGGVNAEIVWASPDGRTWVQVPGNPLGGAYVQDAVQFSERIVAVGSSADTAAWVWIPPKS